MSPDRRADPALVIRRAEASDAPTLGLMHAEVFLELYFGVLPESTLAQLSPEAMAALWHRFVSRGERYVQWVAELGGDPVGFVGTGPGREIGYEAGTELYFLVVAPGVRRRGIARALLRQADPDYLWVWEENRAARTFYRKQKFFPDSVARDGSLFGAPLREVRMSR
ncbi:GNAT family N-acetyltransferase [Galbitalea sp. SE-J8]|uniref:GNAT family N-acetyltransferase n=1 Tax=Galbitalea sp. SE-J8 TaxID=3054952 RepID=UPI00259D188C|nr:GNAT family N-acetyltransferase [Galbitalea sp. SE-J8]MDM4761566.1 GNAT family N-acetyltransferase [Galbitalea sp. SE-J8]